MPEWMVEKGIEGGGYPSKVDTLVKQIALDRHAPVPDYIQVEGNDLEILKLACKSGRMPCVTYNRSLTGRYNGQNIAHMVNLVRADDDFIAVLDNNYIGDTNYEYLSPEEFKRVYGSGWCVILLASSPPPPPHP
jgi:hypothetical protein